MGISTHQKTKYHNHATTPPWISSPVRSYVEWIISEGPCAEDRVFHVIRIDEGENSPTEYKKLKLNNIAYNGKEYPLQRKLVVEIVQSEDGIVINAPYLRIVGVGIDVPDALNSLNEKIVEFFQALSRYSPEQMQTDAIQQLENISGILPDTVKNDVLENAD